MSSESDQDEFYDATETDLCGRISLNSSAINEKIGTKIESDNEKCSLLALKNSNPVYLSSAVTCIANSEPVVYSKLIQNQDKKYLHIKNQQLPTNLDPSNKHEDKLDGTGSHKLNNILNDLNKINIGHSNFLSIPFSTSGLKFSSMPTLHVNDLVIPSSSHSTVLKNPLKELLYESSEVAIRKDEEIGIEQSETGSICSESLFDTLSLSGKCSKPSTKYWRNSRGRLLNKSKESYKRPVSDCEKIPFGQFSFGECASADAYPSERTSAPFKVIEVDDSSISSSTVIDKINKVSSINEIKCDISKASPIYSPSSSDISVVLHENKPKLGSDDSLTAQHENSLKKEKCDALVAQKEKKSTNESSDHKNLYSPEPDIVASTKSNSMPRTETEVCQISPKCERLDKNLLSQVINTNSKTEVSQAEAVASHSNTYVPKVILPKLGEPIVGSSLIKVKNYDLNQMIKLPASNANIFASPESLPEFPPIAPPRRKRKKKCDESETQSLSTSSVSSYQPHFKLPLSNAAEDTISHHMDISELQISHAAITPQDNVQHGTFFGKINLRSHTIVDNSSTQSSFIPGSRTSSKIDSADYNKQYNRTCSLGPMRTNVAQKTKRTCSVEPISSHNRKSSLIVSGYTDEDILKRISLTNLDTGESLPLSDADQYIPEALNPLSLHIMRLTSVYCRSDASASETDDESVADETIKLPEIDAAAIKKKTAQFKRFLGRRVENVVSMAKNIKHKAKEEKDVFENDTPTQNTMQFVKMKTSRRHRGPVEFDNLMYMQELVGEHTGPVWCMKFSQCGRLLATAGQDTILRVWVLKQSFHYFIDIRTKLNADVKSQHESPTPSQESLASHHSAHSSDPQSARNVLDPNDDGLEPFMPKPFCVYTGHTADVLDVAWSKNYFMLTSSMDKTVRLWNISRKECLCVFKHVDFVTAIAFHPKVLSEVYLGKKEEVNLLAKPVKDDDRYFISGSLDGKLRLWSIPDKQVVMWNEIAGQPQLITAANFCQNGTYIVVGTYNGRCIFYKTEELKYFTQIHVKSTRGKRSRGFKITGIEPLPGKDMLLITSNDSRIRLYDLNVLNVSCKYKGYSNVSSQIKAGFSHDGKFIVAGSENQCIYIWKTQHDYSSFPNYSSARKDRNVYWEGVKAHNAVVTCAIFSPRPEHVFSFIDMKRKTSRSHSKTSTPEHLSTASPDENSNAEKGYMLVSADFNGCIKIFLKKEKPKHSSLPASALERT